MGYTHVSSYALKEDTVRDAGSPSSAEWWFVYVVLLATAVIPGLAAKYSLLSQTMIQVFWSIAYVIAGWQLLQMRSKVLPVARQCAPLWAIVFLMFASTLWSVDSYTTIIGSIELLGTTIVGLYIALRFTLSELLWIVAMMFVTVACLSLLIVFANPGYGREYWGSGPWQGIYQDKNNLGAAASLAIISQVAVFRSFTGRRRWVLAAGTLLAFVLLLGSNSATAFGDCAAVLVGVLVANVCRSPRFGGFARFATVLGITVTVAAIFAFNLTPDSVFNLLGRQSNLTGRTDFWPYLQQAVADRPILGFGYDAFFQSPTGVQYLSAYVEQAGGWTPYHAHNSFLQLEIDAGFVGLAMLILVLVTSFARAMAYFTRERSSIGVWPLAIMLFLTIGSFTETYYLNYNTLEWILFMAAIVYPLQKSSVTAAVAIVSDTATPVTTRATAFKRNGWL